MNEGVEVVSARLSWDHLAHLIKHRGFNLVFSFRRFQKTTSTSSSTTENSRQQATLARRRTDTHRHTYTSSARIARQWHSDLVQEETFATHRYFGLSTRFPQFLCLDKANCVSIYWCLPSAAEPPTVKPLACFTNCMVAQCWECGCSTLVTYCTLPETVLASTP